jgi:hypothetical protein
MRRWQQGTSGFAKGSPVGLDDANVPKLEGGAWTPE